MTERELLKKIEESGKKVEVPESLSPEVIRRKLEDVSKEEVAVAEGRNGSSRKNGLWWKRNGKYVKVAAAVALLAMAGGTYAFLGADGEKTSVNVADAKESTDENLTGEAIAKDSEAGLAAPEEDDSQQVLAAESKQDAGDLYIVAGDYGRVYDILERSPYYYETNSIAMGAAMEDVERGEVSEDFVQKLQSAQNVMESAHSAENSAIASASGTIKDLATNKESYTKTNLQTVGVDESDIVKTDGSYIYTVSSNQVIITDVQGEKMQRAGEITVFAEGASDRIVEMYVDGNLLNLIVQKETSSLRNGNPMDKDVYYMSTETVTEVRTYDISNRKGPKEQGCITQDGFYKTSRKIGDVLYLFTEKSVAMPQVTREKAVTEGEVGGWIPVVNGNAITADRIYLPKQGNDGLVISSVNVKNPGKIVDNVMILNNYVDIYVSTEALYLYGREWSSTGDTTQIAKFSLKEGVINAVGAASARGVVRDTFAINEYEGKLRLLTTDWKNGGSENQLYLFDEKMQLTGTLEGVAKGEEIYAARFLANTAYFVTYRNTDPLFAVDLTDEKNPKILSELEITGFSEYLHFWGKDKLLGIGYETDPESGVTKGIKLTMFDISNPSNLAPIATCVIKNINYSPALYNYKCVLADTQENLIGFAAESYKNSVKKSYLLFSWEDGNFKELLTEGIEDTKDTEQYRGLYIGQRFYLVNPDSIVSFDRGNGYKLLERLELD